MSLLTRAVKVFLVRCAFCLNALKEIRFCLNQFQWKQVEWHYVSGAHYWHFEVFTCVCIHNGEYHLACVYLGGSLLLYKFCVQQYYLPVWISYEYLDSVSA
jgi:hypothetical protein